MKVKKIIAHPEKIIIDLVLCPKTNLYLQSLYCHRCGYFNSDEDSNIICDYKKPLMGTPDHHKEVLIKLFSEIKKEITPQEGEKRNDKEKLIFNLDVLKAELNKEMEKRKNFTVSK